MENQTPEWFRRMVPEHINEIPPYSPGKPVQELQRETGIENAIKMASNENPFGPSPKGAAAIQACLNTAHVYPEDAPGDLRDAIADRFNLSRDHVILGNGSDEVLSLIAHLLLSPGREVIVAQHTFSLYGILAQSFGARVKRVPMKDYCFDLNATVKAINDNTSIVFLTSPNNPTGSIIAANDLEAFLDDLPDQPPVIVMDQAYAEFVTEETCAMGENYLFQEKPMLVLRTFSKAYGLAGLRIGYGLSQPWLISLLNKIRPPFSVNALAHCAAMAAVSDDLHLKRTRENNSQGMKQLTADLESMGLKVIPSQANFISFLVGPHASRVYSDLLKEGVIVRHLGSFGMEEYLRVTIGLPEHNERMINALRKALAQRS